VEDFVEELESAVEVNLDPTRRLLDGLARVVRAPSFDEAEPQDAQSSEVVHSDARGSAQALD
jgi:pantothenate synthetase